MVTPTETMKVRLIHDQLQEKPRFNGFYHGVRYVTVSYIKDLCIEVI